MESLDHSLGILKVDATVFVLLSYIPYIPYSHSPGEGFPYKKDVVLVVPFKG